MKSLRDLSNELLGVRLYGTNTSLWHLAGTVTEAARVALNDALQTYEFTVKRTYTSLVVPDVGQYVAVLPMDVLRVTEIRAGTNTTTDRPRKIKGFELRPTHETNLLYVDASVFPGATGLEVMYETRLTEIPPDCVVASQMTVGQKSVIISGGVPAAQFRAPGYLKIHAMADTTHHELVRYEAVTANSFTGLTRNVGGKSVASSWSLGDIISQALELPEQAMSVIQHAAQAEMYHFWVRNRATYDQFTAVASLQQLDLGDLLGLIRTEEDRADRRYKRSKQAPEPGYVERKRVRK